ncbi:Chitin binding Peritrophin-A domain [Popillia japonica]|uniref:Chitin binding Peritrophin-A domain n=1 Tax=Popillia japonica TaxID=7064 RepID=A0AAW1MNR5_POPJA
MVCLNKKKGVGISWTVAFLVLWSTATVATPVGECPSSDYGNATFLRDSADCSVFYFCNWGEPIEFVCPNGLLFNLERNSCDWAEDTECSVVTEEVPTCDGCSRAKCPAINDDYVTFFPHDTDCGKYCMCDWGVAYERPCPAGLHWNTKLDVCDWPHSAGCTLGEDGGCNAATEDTPTENSSTEDSSTDSSTNSTDIPPISSEGCENIMCPENNKGNVTFFPHEDNCERYCVCNWGNAISMSCPPGLHFNTDLEVCDNIGSANCDISGELTTEIPTESTDETENLSTQVPTSTTETETDAPVEETTGTSATEPAEETTTTTEVPEDQSTEGETEGPVEETTTTTEVPEDQSTEGETEGPVEETTTTTEVPEDQSTEAETEGPVEETTTTTEVPEDQSTEAETEGPKQKDQQKRPQPQQKYLKINQLRQKQKDQQKRPQPQQKCLKINQLRQKQKDQQKRSQPQQKYLKINQLRQKQKDQQKRSQPQQKYLKINQLRQKQKDQQKRPQPQQKCLKINQLRQKPKDQQKRSQPQQKYLKINQLRQKQKDQQKRPQPQHTTEVPEDQSTEAETEGPAEETTTTTEVSEDQSTEAETEGPAEETTTTTEVPEDLSTEGETEVPTELTTTNAPTEISTESTTHVTTEEYTEVPTDDSCSDIACLATTQTVLYSHKTVCNKFCICSFGMVMEVPCIGDFQFNSALDGTSETEEDLTELPEANDDGCSYAACSAANSTTFYPHKSDYNTDVTTVAPAIPPTTGCSHAVCSKTDDPVFFGHATDCGKYCVCNYGFAVEMPCPSGLYFNTELDICDYPQNVSCNENLDQSTPAPPESPVNSESCAHEVCMNDNSAFFYPHVSDCSKYCICSLGLTIEMACPTGSYYSQQLNTCNNDEDADCEESEDVTYPSVEFQGCLNVTCPDIDDDNVTFYPHDFDCERYCVCNWGYAIEMPCPEGLYFNTDLNVCDIPENSGCYNEEATTTEEENGSSTTEGGEEEETNETEPDDLVSTTETTEEDISSTSTTEDVTSTTEPAISTTEPEVPTTEPTVPIIGCDSALCPLVNDVYVTFLAHKLDCGKYCVCDWGRAIEMSCPPGLHFNTNYNVCDYPSNAKCTV